MSAQKPTHSILITSFLYAVTLVLATIGVTQYAVTTELAYQEFLDQSWLFWAHLVSLGVVVITAPMLFITNRPLVVVVLQSFAALSALSMMGLGLNHPVFAFGSSFSLIGFVWLLTACCAVFFCWNRHWRQAVEWAKATYVLALGLILFRVLLGLTMLMDWQLLETRLVASVWVAPLVVSLVWLSVRGRQMFRLR